MKDPAELLGHVVRKKRSAHEFEIRRRDIVEACTRLRNGGYGHLSLITTVDWKDRWEILYHIVRYGKRQVAVLRVTLPYEDPSIPSVASVWPSADWHERENYDLMGIVFKGHPDLRRILMPEGYGQFPLRKEVLHGNRS